jgi:hypothetical protein
MSRQYGIDVKNIRLSYRSDVTNLRNEMYNPRTDLPNRKQLVLIAFFEVEIETTMIILSILKIGINPSGIIRIREKVNVVRTVIKKVKIHLVLLLSPHKYD